MWLFGLAAQVLAEPAVAATDEFSAYIDVSADLVPTALVREAAPDLRVTASPFTSQGTVSAPPPAALGVEIPDARKSSRTKRHTIFVNFDGGTLTHGAHDGRKNETGIERCAGAYPGYGDASTKRAALLQAVRADFAPFDLEITATRPTEGDFTTIMVGPQRACCSYGGVAPLFCGNANRNAVAFSCADVSSSLGIGAQATTISQEAAHTFGLMHVDRPADIMHPVVRSGADPSFIDECLEYEPKLCSGQRTECQGDRQNSFRELLALFGPSSDYEAPSITMVSPEDGLVVAPGTPVVVATEIDSGRPLASVDLWVDDRTHKGTPSTPRWTLEGLDLGSHRLRVVATDDEGNLGQSATIVVHVGDADPELASHRREETAGDAEAAELESSASGCRTTGLPTSPALGFGWVLAVGAARRRQRHRP